MEDKKESDEKVNNKKIIRHTIVVYLTIAVATFTAVVLLYSCVLRNDLNDRRQGNRQPSRLQIWPRPGKIRCCNILCP